MSAAIEKVNGKKLDTHIKEMENTVKDLESNLKETNHAGDHIIMSLQTDKIKFEGLNTQLQDALKENKELINFLQQGGEPDVCQRGSQGDVTSSCSTVSIVHLQYKYEELLANHYGLLKLLEMRSEEVKKTHEENCQLKSAIERYKSNLSHKINKVQAMHTKILRIKERKNEKIHKLKMQNETLQLVHNQLVNMLHVQCMEKDQALSQEIKNCSESSKALLLQEMRKNNMLIYENFQLGQTVEHLKSHLHNHKTKREKAKSVASAKTA